jgi:hypothetical protein
MMVFYFFVFRYGYTMNPNLYIFGIYTLFFGVMNAIGIKLAPTIFLPVPRNDRRNGDDREEDLLAFFESSIVMVLFGIIITLVVSWYG